MEIVVLIIMALVCVSFVIKLSFHHLAGIVISSAVSALFIGLTWELAVVQSKTQIADWLAQPDLMLDTSVLLTIDVFIQIAFCLQFGRKLIGEKMRQIESVALALTLWIPGILIFPVLFSALVELIFSFPGVNFAKIAWIFAATILILIPALAFCMKMLFPARGMRLELIFIVNGLIAVLGVIATVNGRTAVNGTSEVEWGALAGICAIMICGAIIGHFITKFIDNKRITKILKTK